MRWFFLFQYIYMQVRNIKRYTFLLLIVLRVCTLNAQIREERYNYNCIHFDGNNNLWIGTRLGLHEWQQNNSKKVNELDVYNVSAIASYHKSLLLGTQSGKVYRYQPDERKVNLIFDAKKEITNIHVDAKQSTGVIYFENNTELFIDAKQIQQNRFETHQTQYLKKVEQKNMAIHLAINHQLTLTKNKDSFHVDTPLLSLLDFQVNDFLLLKHCIALATNKGGLLIDFDGNMLQKIEEKKSFEQVEKDAYGFLWFRGKHCLASHYGEMLLPQLQPISVDTIATSNAPLNKLQSFVYTQTGKPKHFLIDAKNNVWIAKPNQGIVVSNGMNLKQLGVKDGLSAYNYHAIIEYDKYILALSNTNIDAIKKSEHTIYHLPFNQYLKSPTFLKPKNDTQRIYVVDYDKTFSFQLPSQIEGLKPTIKIKKCYVMDKLMTAKQHIFQHDENYFKFEFAPYSFHDEILYFRYKLIGLSDRWIHTSENEIIFPRLNAGRYTLHIEVSNTKQFAQSSQDNYSFEIKKPFWQTNLFILGTMLAIGFLIFQYIKTREARLKETQQYETQKAIAEFEVLKQQVNPHFLFNSFNTLMQIIDEDKNKAIDYAHQLSNYYRSLITYRDVQLISLEEDIELLENYINLQKTRFDDDLTLLINLPFGTKKKYALPPLSLQLLAENAIKHNIISEQKPLMIELLLEKETICMRNNVSPKTKAEPSEKIGIQNIKNRFRQYIANEILIEHNEHSFSIHLPLIKSELI
jgi:sensor histidine kinase YesM